MHPDDLTPLQEEMLVLVVTERRPLALLILDAVSAVYGRPAVYDDDRLREALRDLKALEAHGLVDTGGQLR